MIGTDENRAVLHVEVIFWSGKRKTPPSPLENNAGANAVGKGRVLGRTVPYQVKQQRK